MPVKSTLCSVCNGFLLPETVRTLHLDALCQSGKHNSAGEESISMH